MSSLYKEFEENTYDYAILGTGIVETMIAASFSHQKKSIVVIDPHKIYGLHSSYLSHREIENALPDLTTQHHVDIPLTNEKYSRSIYVDLTPQLFYSNGDLIHTITDAEIHKYLDFISLDTVYIYVNDQIVRVPDSKQEIFQTTIVPVKEKLFISNFLKELIEEKDMTVEETKLFKAFEAQGENRSFRRILEGRKFTKMSQDLVIYGLCLSSTDDIVDGHFAVSRLQKYITSLGKYGSSPFILCRYGSGDVAQGFSRSASIVGTVFLCNHSFTDITKNEETQEYHIACQSPESRNGVIPFTVKSKNVIKSSFFEAPNNGKRVDYLQFFTPEELTAYSKKSYISMPNIAHNAIQCLLVNIDNMTTVCLSVEHHEEDEENVLQQALEKIIPNYREIGVYMVSYSMNLHQASRYTQLDNGILITSDGTLGINSDIDVSVKEAESICGVKLFKDDEIVGQVSQEDLEKLSDTN